MRISGKHRTATAPSIIDIVAQQTTEAADLAAIDGQELLEDPLTNPAVRAHADQLRDDEHHRALEARHTRRIRAIRVEDRRASDAERALNAIRAARETTSPARSVLALHRGRARFMRVSLAASLTLSAGAAIGVASLAEQLGAPQQTGYIAELGFTGLSTLVILYRSHLTRHSNTLDSTTNTILWTLMLAPLLASITANAYSTGLVGIACSIGAAAFSLLSHIIATASAAAIHTNTQLITTTDEHELQTIATETRLIRIPSPGTAEPRSNALLPNQSNSPSRQQIPNPTTPITPDAFATHATEPEPPTPADDPTTNPVPQQTRPTSTLTKMIWRVLSGPGFAQALAPVSDLVGVFYQFDLAPPVGRLVAG